MNILQIMQSQPSSAIAITANQSDFTYHDIITLSLELVDWLQAHHVDSVCIDVDNSLDWVLIDLACQYADILCTPVPQFFSQTQTAHLYERVKPNVVFSNKTQLLGSRQTLSSVSCQVYLMPQTALATVPRKTNKVTFTSGSTGAPKGVCLSVNNQMVVAESLALSIGLKHIKHLVLLPLSTLLENIAGIYAPLINVGHIIIPSDVEKGFTGSKLVDVIALLSCIAQHKPNSMILVPELLQVLVMSCKQGWQAPSSLSFIAVGGAKVSAQLMHEARELGLPVFQGYGLSECASVVSLCINLNAPLDSVGPLLPHVSAKVEDGVLHVTGNTFLGYIDERTSWYPKWVDTGDKASIRNNTIYISGRAKNTIINSFGRNISPEWIESTLAATGLFRQIMIVGDSKPHLLAILHPAAKNMANSFIESAIAKINQTLPDYAQVLSHIILTEPMTEAQGLVTENGRLKREKIQAHFSQDINQSYQSLLAV